MGPGFSLRVADMHAASGIIFDWCDSETAARKGETRLEPCFRFGERAMNPGIDAGVFVQVMAPR